MEKNPPIRHRGLARALVLLASVLALLALLSIWVNRQVLNTDNWTDTSAAMLENDVIRGQVATYLVDELYANVDVQGQISAALPARAQALAAPAAGALRSFAERAANEALQRPRAQQAWENANRVAHQLLLKTLAGGGPIVSTTGGAVVLDLKALLTQTEERVGVGGGLAAKLPEDAAKVTVLESDQLDLAQAGYDFMRKLPIVLVALSLALFGIALWISSGWRRNAVRLYGIGLLAIGAIALVAVAWFGDYVTVSLARTKAGEPLVREVWVLSTTLLREVALATIFYGCLLFFGALLAGPSVTATAIRRSLAPYLRETAWAYGAMVLILGIVFLWWTPTPAMRNPATAVLLAALILAGFEALRRKTAREFPDADFRVATAHIRERLSEIGKPKDIPDAAPMSADARVAALERLKKLHDSGGLSEKEFSAEKARLLAV